MKKKKVLYISNINLKGPFLLGVVEKIKGQVAAFTEAGFTIDTLSVEDKDTIVFTREDGTRELFKGYLNEMNFTGIISKIIRRLQVIWYGNMSFYACEQRIVDGQYDAVYLRFFLPGADLIRGLQRFRKLSPQTLILLEYPTLNVKETFDKDVVRKISYACNVGRIKKLNNLSDYIITLTKDKELFGRPAVFMANGIDLTGIKPVATPAFTDTVVILGVASDCAFYHGFDKVIRGLSEYHKKGSPVHVLFRIVSNPLSTNVTRLKELTKELNAEEEVVFELPKTRQELAIEYGKVHLGMGTLALHRIGLNDNYSLKHREYAAFGLPFIMSKGDAHFEDSPYVMVEERNEEPLDIQQIVDFYLQLREKHPDYPGDFRKSMEPVINWEAQMNEVFSVINKGK